MLAKKIKQPDEKPQIFLQHEYREYSIQCYNQRQNPLDNLSWFQSWAGGKRGWERCFAAHVLSQKARTKSSFEAVWAE